MTQPREGLIGAGTIGRPFSRERWSRCREERWSGLAWAALAQARAIKAGIDAGRYWYGPEADTELLRATVRQARAFMLLSVKDRSTRSSTEALFPCIIAEGRAVDERAGVVGVDHR